MKPPASRVPNSRVRLAADRAIRPDGAFVLYWMTAFRRTRYNFALDHAVAWSKHLSKPLVILEALSVDYEYASERLHAFVIDGMGVNARAALDGGAVPYPYVEPRPGAGKGLLESLSASACVVIGDDAPVHDLPSMISAAASRMSVRFEVVDANGVMPLSATDRVFGRAYDHRRYMQKHVLGHLDDSPDPDPLRGLVPGSEELLVGFLERWPKAQLARSVVSGLPLDRLAPTPLVGGSDAATDRLQTFVANKLPKYLERSHPDEHHASGLSPYLHFGQISAQEVFDAVAETELWNPAATSQTSKGQREGWWGMSAPAEAFLDQVLNWRELGFNGAWNGGGGTTFESLPQWAIDSLELHARDPREHVYTRDQFERAETHDRVWNAAQTQLLSEGVVQNYMRMLWGKKILHWSRTPAVALDTMLYLNNRYALDGRDPNSTSGITWVMGRYDRPWPERPIFGKVRYMTSKSTMSKLRAKRYVERYSLGPPLFEENS